MTVSGRSEHTELGQETGTPCACESSALGVGDSVTTAASLLVSSSAGGAQRMLGCLSALLAVHQPRHRHGAHQCWLCLPGPRHAGEVFPTWVLPEKAADVGSKASCSVCGRQGHYCFSHSLEQLTFCPRYPLGPGGPAISRQLIL